MDTSPFGTFLAQLRKSKGMTQKQLGNLLGVSDKTISHWERGETMPDILLLPTIADLFSVSCDELLKGAYSPVNTSVPLSDAPGNLTNTAPNKANSNSDFSSLNFSTAEKSASLNLKSTLLNSSLIAALGFIIALILNFGFNMGLIGFFVALAFYIGACVYIITHYNKQAFFLTTFALTGKNSLNTKSILFPALQKGLSFLFFLFALTLPFAFVPAYTGLAFSSWLSLALPFALLMAIIRCWALIAPSSFFIKHRLIPTDFITATNQKNWLLLKKTLAFTFLFIGITLLLQTIVVNKVSFSKGLAFTDAQSFKEYMETPIDEDALPLSLSDFSYEQNEYPEEILDENGEVLLTFIHRNKLVSSYSHPQLSKNSPFLVTVYTQDMFDNAYQRREFWADLFNKLILGEILIGVLFYMGKKKKAASPF